MTFLVLYSSCRPRIVAIIVLYPGISKLLPNSCSKMSEATWVIIIILTQLLLHMRLSMLELMNRCYGMKLFYLCISTFAPSSNLTPFVMSHLAMFAHTELPSELVGFNSIEDLATNCWISYDLLARTVGPGETGDPPSMQDIEQLTMGKLTPMNEDEIDDAFSSPGLPGAPPGIPDFDDSMLPGPPPGAPPPGPP